VISAGPSVCVGYFFGWLDAPSVGIEGIYEHVTWPSF
jgi:hypothetical protein